MGIPWSSVTCGSSCLPGSSPCDHQRCSTNSPRAHSQHSFISQLSPAETLWTETLGGNSSVARQHLSLTVFYGHVLANSLRGNKVPGGPQMSSHVTFLALPQGHPVPLEVMFLLRKSLCHTWDRKNIYFESQSNHSELAQPFQELPGQQRKTGSERKDESLCCQARDNQLLGEKGRVCHFDSRSKYFWPAMHDGSILVYTPHTMV